MKYHLRSVVILDDDPVSGFILFNIIERYDLFTKQVQLFSSPQRLLSFLNDTARHPDCLPELIFLDIQMPIIDGFQFIEYMTMLPGNASRNIKIVLLSSFEKDQNIDRLIKEKKIITFIQKPPTLDDLHEVIRIFKGDSAPNF